MYLHLKKIEINEGNSQETTCYSAHLWLNNVHIGWCGNDGQGGCDRIQFCPPETPQKRLGDYQRLEQLFEQAARELSAGPDGFSSLTSKMATLKQECLSGEVFFRLKNRTYDRDEWSATHYPGYVKDLKQYLEDRFKDAVVEIYEPSPFSTKLPDSYFASLKKIFPTLEKMSEADMWERELTDIDVASRKLEMQLARLRTVRDHAYRKAIKAKYGIFPGAKVLYKGEQALVYDLYMPSYGNSDLSKPAIKVYTKNKNGAWSKRPGLILCSEYELP